MTPHRQLVICFYRFQLLHIGGNMIWTICFLVRKNKNGKIKEVCLAMKKRGHGVGKWNGTGGKPLEGEDLENTAKRETQEEIGILVLNIQKMAEIEFKDLARGESHFAYGYICTKWEGNPKETEEMRPQWFSVNEIPFDQMWSADKIWIPEILKGKNIKAVFEYTEGDLLSTYRIDNIPS